MHVHLVMLMDSIFDLAEYWEETSSGTRKQPTSFGNVESSYEINSLTLSNIYGGGSELVCEGSYDDIVNNNYNNEVRQARTNSLLSVESFSQLTSPHIQKSPQSESADVQWRDHDQLEMEELHEKIQRLERQVKLDSESLVKAKMKCMDYELLCEENQRLQRNVLELEYKLQQQRENSQLELQFSKLEMKSLHQRILEISSELDETKKSFQDTSMVTSHQKEDNTQMKQQNEQLELHNAVLEDQVKSLFEEKEELRRSITTLEEELHTIHMSKAQLDSEVNQLQKLLLSKEKQEAMLMSALQQRAIVDAQYRQLETNQSHQIKIIEDLKNTIRSKEKDLAGALIKIDMAERQVMVLQTELNAMRDTYEENRNLAESLTAKVDALESSLETRDHEKSDLLLEMESIRNDIALERMNSQILKDDLVVISRENLRMRQDITALERDLDDLQRQLEYEHEQNQLLRSGSSQPSASLSSNASAKAAAVINMFKMGASAVSGVGNSESSVLPEVDNPPPGSADSRLLEQISSGHSTIPSTSQLSNSEELSVEQSLVTSNNNTVSMKESNDPPLVVSSGLVIVSDNDSNESLTPLVSGTSYMTPTPASIFNGSSTEINYPASTKISNRFKFSLPSAPQLNINKLQLPSGLSGRSGNSAVSPLQIGGAGEPKKSSSDVFPSLSSSSRLLSFGKKKISETDISRTVSPLDSKSGVGEGNSFPLPTKAQGYESYEDNDSDSDEKEDLNPGHVFRSNEQQKKVFADYSYD